MKPNAPSFESLPAKEKQKLTTYGDGTPPFAGYEFDFDASIPRWVPGEGVEDAYVGQGFETVKAAPAVSLANAGMIFVTKTKAGVYIAAYKTRERAWRDVEMIGRATNETLDIIELPLEA